MWLVRVRGRERVLVEILFIISKDPIIESDFNWNREKMLKFDPIIGMYRTASGFMLRFMPSKVRFKIQVRVHPEIAQ